MTQPAQETQGAPPVVAARNLTKRYGDFRALDAVDFTVPAGAISGLIGPNGAGKTTTLKALIGLCQVDGELSVAGRDPRRARHKLMEDVCFIADVGTLPAWLRVRQLIDYVEAVHPRFDRRRAEELLATTEIPPGKQVKQLSKGMVTQLHLAVVMAIDVRLLVLDEPTLGLDIIYRKEFYDRLLNDYYDGRRTIIISTHQVEEIEALLSHLLFIDRGRIVLDMAMADVAARYLEVVVAPERVAEARSLAPLHEREILGRVVCLFEDGEPHRLRSLGEARVPAVADLFVAKMKNHAAAAHGRWVGGQDAANTPS